jgi:hypothetical protein
MSAMSDDEVVPGLSRVLERGVPQEAIAFYARWWQLETWLREVAYVELRARYGEQWASELDSTAHQRAKGEARNFYMPSADADELLAYADVAALFTLIEERWELFERMLPPRRRWVGLADELKELRNRNAHCRRPHSDDVARVDQALRDIEPGAWRFYVTYLDTRLAEKSKDPVTRSWVSGRHESAMRLLKHAERQYETRFRLSYSVRPWAAWPGADHISGSAGVLWHAHWTIGGRDLNVVRLWREIERHGDVRSRIIHLLFDVGSVTVTFSALDGSDAVADAIGSIFDAVLTESRPSRSGHLDMDEWAANWFRGAEELPRCVQVRTPLTLIEPYAPRSFSIFGA